MLECYILNVITEGKKYFSGVLRNIGFALLAPFCSLMFQWFVFKKDVFSGHFYLTVLLFVLGFITILLGYTPLKEKIR